MAEVIQLATGQTVQAEGAALDYYRGEAATVGGYSIDGEVFPAKIDESDFDPNGHNLDEIAQHMANSTPREQARVLALEAEGKARKTLVGDEPADVVSPFVDAPVGVPVVDSAGAHAADESKPV